MRSPHRSRSSSSADAAPAARWIEHMRLAPDGPAGQTAVGGHSTWGKEPRRENADSTAPRRRTAAVREMQRCECTDALLLPCEGAGAAGASGSCPSRLAANGCPTRASVVAKAIVSSEPMSGGRQSSASAVADACLWANSQVGNRRIRRDPYARFLGQRSCGPLLTDTARTRAGAGAWIHAEAQVTGRRAPVLSLGQAITLRTRAPSEGRLGPRPRARGSKAGPVVRSRGLPGRAPSRCARPLASSR